MMYLWIAGTVLLHCPCFLAMAVLIQASQMRRVMGLLSRGHRKGLYGREIVKATCVGYGAIYTTLNLLIEDGRVEYCVFRCSGHRKYRAAP